MSPGLFIPDHKMRTLNSHLVSSPEQFIEPCSGVSRAIPIHPLASESAEEGFPSAASSVGQPPLRSAPRPVCAVWPLYSSVGEDAAGIAFLAFFLSFAVHRISSQPETNQKIRPQGADSQGRALFR